MIYEQFGELKYEYRNRSFWCRGYYVDTVGKNERRIAEYIKHQLDEDRLGDQLRIPEVDEFASKNKEAIRKRDWQTAYAFPRVQRGVRAMPV